MKVFHIHPSVNLVPLVAKKGLDPPPVFRATKSTKDTKTKKVFHIHPFVNFVPLVAKKTSILHLFLHPLWLVARWEDRVVPGDLRIHSRAIRR